MEPVTGLRAAPGINAVQLTWANPSNPDPEGIYVEVSGPQTRVVALPGAPTQTTINGLRNGVEYSFRVIAATRHGSAGPSEWAKAAPTTGVEGVVAGLIVEFATDVREGETAVPGEERVDEVELTVAERVGDEAVLVDFAEPVDLQTAERIANELEADDAVKWAEPDQFFFISANELAQTVTVPTDSQYASDQWNLWDAYGIGVGNGAAIMTDAWAGARGDGVNVAVIDTGITAHPDLDEQLIPGYDFVSNPEQLAASRQANAPPVAFDGDYVDGATYGSLGRDANPADPGDWRGVAPTRNSTWHGTKMAGLIAAAANDEGITGIAPNAKIQPIRALSWRGGLLSDIAASITWASGGSIDGAPENTAPSKVINMSFAVETMCPVALQQAIDGAIERGSILVAAAGNANDDASKYAPGNCNGVITVGATNRDGHRADYSNYGSTIDLSAPGGGSGHPVTSASNSGIERPDQPTTEGDFGTSIAAAHVSGAAAILASRQSTLTPQAAFGALTGRAFTKEFANSGCDNSNPEIACGSGILSLAQVAAAGDSGPIDYYMDFNGANQRAIGASSYYPMQTGSGQSFTLSAWVYDTDSVKAWRYIAAQGQSAGNDFWLGTSNDIAHDRQEIMLSSLWTGVLLPENEWVHIAVTRSGANATLYINGQAVFTTTGYPQPGDLGGQPFRVGAFVDDRSEYWKGRIDQVKVYTSALTASQVAEDMNTYGAPASATGLVAHYDFNEGTTGATVVNHGTDGLSGNLTPANGPTYVEVVEEVTPSPIAGVKTLKFTRSYLTSARGWMVPAGVSTARALIVGGGGAGGFDGGGGGGGGGAFEGAVTLTPGSAQTVTVGMGGNSPRRGWNPSNSCLDANFQGATGCIGNSGTSSTFGTKTASGGGGGGGKNANGISAASADAAGAGGGGGSSDNIAKATEGGGSSPTKGGGGSGSTQGGGGGGAAGEGTKGTGVDGSGSGKGGAGLLSSKSGSPLVYGGGGAGGSWWACNYCIGEPASGAGWGGYGDTAAGSGTANRGGGGGGGGGGTATGGRGGSGIVIIQYGATNQSTLTISSSSSQVFGGSVSLATSGGSGTGLVSFSVTTSGTAGCSITGTTLTATGAAGTTCGITATKAGDDTYLAATATQTITVTTRPITITASSPSITIGGSVSPTVSVTVGTLATGNAISGATYTYAGNGTTVYPSSTTAPSAEGTYSITPSAATFSSGSASNYLITYAAGALTISKPSQSALTLTSISGTYGAGLPLTTSGGSSTGAVTYAVTGVGTASGCSVTDGSLTVTSAGTCLVTATKAGDADYAPVSSPQTTVTFAKATQASFSISSQSTVVYGNGFTLTTSGGSGAGAVTYQLGSTTGTAHCSITGSPSTLTGTDAGGTCEVIAEKAGDTNYDPIIAPTQLVTVTTRPIILTASSPTIAYGSAVSPSVSVTTGSLGFTDAISGATYKYAGTGATVYASSTTAPSAVGTYSVTPSAATFSSGSASNYAIAYVPGVLTILKTTQTIMFSKPSNVTYGAAPFAVAPTSTSGLPVSVTSNSTSVCTVDGNVVTIVGSAIGGAICSLTASQSGDANYSAATPQTQTFTVGQASQATLTMSSPSSAVFGETVTLAASGGSGTGAVSFSVTSPIGPGLCSVSGTTLTLGNAGSVCKVQATKAASANYLIATSVEQTIVISKAGQTIDFTSSVPASPLPNDTYSPSAVAVSTVTGSSSDIAPAFAVSGACTLAGGAVAFTVTGTCTITASAAGNVNFTAAADATQVIVVGSLNQTITFTQPANVEFGSSSVSMGASSTSDLTVTYSLGIGTTNSSCSVSTLGVVAILAVGTCEVTASQGGDAKYAAASSVTRAFQVVPALATAPSLTSASASSQAITVGFVAPGFTGGVPITAYSLVATPVGAGTTVTSSACTTSPCTITGLVNGTAYRVTVAAINAAGTGPTSGASTALTPATAAFAVGSLAATPGDTVVDVTWTQPTDLGGGTFVRYDVYIKAAVGGSYGSPVAIGSIGTTSYRFTGLNNGLSYDFKVVTITTANGSEIPGNTAEVVEYPSTVPSAPRDLHVLSATATDVQISWEVPLSDGGAALASPYYVVTVTSTTAGAASPITCVFASATDRFCTASNLTNGAVYSVSVVAVNRMGEGPAVTSTYAVPSSDATLLDLVVTGSGGAVALSPSFAAATIDYSAAVANGVSSVTVTPTTTMPGSTVTVDAVAVASGSASASIALAVGPNTITVLVTASDIRHTKTYTVVVTRAAASGGGSGDSGERGTTNIPIMPPAEVMAGSTAGAVMVGGRPQSQVAFQRDASGSGWNVAGTDFTFSARTESAAGRPEPLGALGAMQVPQLGRVLVQGTDYLPNTQIDVFAVPRSSGARLLRLATPLAPSGAIHLGSAKVDGGGAVSATFIVSSGVDVGPYVLQVNGLTPADQVRSVNMLMDVIPGAPTMRLGTFRRAAFYAAGSARFTEDGRAKLRALVNSIPAGAKQVQVSVIGVSTSLETLDSNLDLARDRAKRVSSYLAKRGISGTYTITVSTTFAVKGRDRTVVMDGSGHLVAGADELDRHGAVGTERPSLSPDGKPLTTASITFTAPVTTSAS